MIESLFVVGAYFLGSLSSAIIVCKIMGLPDPRGEGSGNPGATNVMRIGGKKAAGITFLGDFLKGFVPVYLVNMMGFNTTVQAIVGLAAFLGHLYPVFFGFKGGKGVATSAGVLLGFSLWLGLAFMLTWLLMYKFGKISSLSALIASVLSSFYAGFIVKDNAIVGGAVVMMAFLLYRHKSNIQRLLAGNEGKPKA